MTEILVTGGAGYIGSHIVLGLQDAGYQPVVVDALLDGADAHLPDDVPFYQCDITNQAGLADVFAQHNLAAVIHCAGVVRVEESVTQPLKYYHYNTHGTQVLLTACHQAGINRFIFSSTAAVYGAGQGKQRLAEQAPCAPINPYGQSKLFAEQVIKDFAAANSGTQYGILRYFNVAGADPQQRAGQRSKGATHLLKVASEVATAKRQHLQIFGYDYDTPDGTCVRDYIHVSDLATAHTALLEALLKCDQSYLLNCGYGTGHSVREVVAAYGSVLGAPLRTQNAPRRAGDPASLVADNTALCQQLDWHPKYNDLTSMIRHALAWEQTL